MGVNTVIGEKFNRWTVLKLARIEKSGKSFFLCSCECGQKREVRKDQLTRGTSKSCGCWKAEVAREQITRLSTTHGLAYKTRTYEVWKDMRKRCNNKNYKNYNHYGGRGIRVCKDWDNYETFLTDMGEAPDSLTLDRKNNEGNYEPENCRWADKLTQANNTRSNLILQFDGETRTLSQWCAHIGIPYQRVYQRLFTLGWGIRRAFEK